MFRDADALQRRCKAFTYIQTEADPDGMTGRPTHAGQAMCMFERHKLVTCCFSSTAAARGVQEVADLRAPWQKAPAAERGASRGVQAMGPG